MNNKMIKFGSLFVSSLSTLAVVSCSTEQINNVIEVKEPIAKNEVIKPETQHIITPLKQMYDQPELEEKKVPSLNILNRESEIKVTNGTYEIQSNHFSDINNRKLNGRIFSTNMFNYFVDDSMYWGKNKINNNQVSELIRYVEANVNYGPASHLVYDGNSFKRIDKFTMAFIGTSESGTSFGSMGYVEIACTNTPFDATETFAKNKGMMALHEYGHHETMVDSQLFKDQFDVENMFKGFKEGLNSYKKFSPLTRYFDTHHNSSASIGMNMQPRETVFGHLGAYHPYWNDLAYTYDKGELATRLNLILSSSDNPSDFVNQNYASYDVVSMINTFGFTPFDNERDLSHLIEIYKDTIFGLDSFDSSKLLMTKHNKSLNLANIVTTENDFNSVRFTFTPHKNIIGKCSTYFSYDHETSYEVFKDCNPGLPRIKDEPIVEEINLTNGLDFDTTSWRFNENYNDSNVEQKIEGKSYFINKDRAPKHLLDTLKLISGYSKDFDIKIEFEYEGKTIKTING